MVSIYTVASSWFRTSIMILRIRYHVRPRNVQDVCRNLNRCLSEPEQITLLLQPIWNESTESDHQDVQGLLPRLSTRSRLFPKFTRWAGICHVLVTRFLQPNPSRLSYGHSNTFGLLVIRTPIDNPMGFSLWNHCHPQGLMFYTGIPSHIIKLESFEPKKAPVFIYCRSSWFWPLACLGTVCKNKFLLLRHNQ